jgi:hypothetical protein
MLDGASAMTTLVTFLGALIASAAILYATYGLTRLALHCVRWTVRSMGPHTPKHVGRPHLRYRGPIY